MDGRADDDDITVQSPERHVIYADDAELSPRYDASTADLQEDPGPYADAIGADRIDESARQEAANVRYGGGYVEGQELVGVETRWWIVTLRFHNLQGSISKK